MWRVLHRSRRVSPRHVFCHESASSSTSSPPVRALSWSAADLRRGVERAPLDLPVGSVHDGFRVVRSTPVPQFHLTVYEMVHQGTNSPYIHVDTADTNNAFCVCFRTPPQDDTGLPHILEHMALCGSAKFPIRDPFFHMLRRSLQTFMNAMTGPDYTLYPFSTQHALDFQNLLRVYTDAAFFPLLKKVDFRQEGFRVEFEEVTDPNSPLVYRGVVYNEMKGAMSDPASILYHDMHKALFPDNTYKYNSGGDPASIPQLSHEDLVAFHRKHYHPSNARFYTYGDLPPSTQLLDSLVMQHFSAADASHCEVPVQASFDEPLVVQVKSPPEAVVADKDKQTNVHVSLVGPDVVGCDRVESIAFALAASLLVKGADSPMHKALVSPNIGSGFGALTGVSSGSRQSVLSVGLQSIRDEDIERVRTIIDHVLRQVCSDGFDQDRIDAMLHQHELSQKSVSTNFGLTLLYRMLPLWIHGGDPVDACRVDELLQKVRDRMKEGPYLQNIVKKYLVDNPHRALIIQRPDPVYLESRLADERARLDAVKKGLAEDDVHTILGEADELTAAQKCHEDVSEAILPTLHREDIVKQMLHVPVEHSMVSATPLQTSVQATNGLMYLRGVVDTSSVPAALKPFVPLFSAMTTAVGAGDLGYEAMDHRRMLYTGGVSSTLHAFSLFDDTSSHRELVSFSVSSLARNIDTAVDILADTIADASFSAEPHRIRQLLLNEASSASSSIADEGHVYALRFAAASMSPCMAAREQYFGLSHLVLLNRLSSAAAASSDGGVEELISALESVADVLAGAKVARCSIVADEESMCLARQALPRFVDRVGGAGESHVNLSSGMNAGSSRPGQQVFFAAPIDVNHVAMCVPTVAYAHEDSAKLRVLAKLMSMRFLHSEIREKGGAYGGGASWSGDGVFNFYSFRDPERDATIDAFTRSVEWALGKHSPSITEDDVEQALLSIFASLDSPEHPRSKGQQLFLYGMTEEVRQEHRSRLLNVTVDDLIDVARRYLSPAMANGTASIAVVGAEQNLPSCSDSDWSVRHTSEMSSWPSHPTPFTAASASATTP